MIVEEVESVYIYNIAESNGNIFGYGVGDGIGIVRGPSKDDGVYGYGIGDGCGAYVNGYGYGDGLSDGRGFGFGNGNGHG